MPVAALPEPVVGGSTGASLGHRAQNLPIICTWPQRDSRAWGRDSQRPPHRADQAWRHGCCPCCPAPLGFLVSGACQACTKALSLTHQEKPTGSSSLSLELHFQLFRGNRGHAGPPRLHFPLEPAQPSCEEGVSQDCWPAASCRRNRLGSLHHPCRVSFSFH